MLTVLYGDLLLNSFYLLNLDKTLSFKMIYNTIMILLGKRLKTRLGHFCKQYPEWNIQLYELQGEKHSFCHVRPTKTQISLQ